MHSNRLSLKSKQIRKLEKLKSSSLKIIPKEAQITKYRKHIRIRSSATKIMNQSCRGLTIEKTKPFA